MPGASMPTAAVLGMHSRGGNGFREGWAHRWESRASAVPQQSIRTPPISDILTESRCSEMGRRHAGKDLATASVAWEPSRPVSVDKASRE